MKEPRLFHKYYLNKETGFEEVMFVETVDNIVTTGKAYENILPFNLKRSNLNYC